MARPRGAECGWAAGVIRLVIRVVCPCDPRGGRGDGFGGAASEEGNSKSGWNVFFFFFSFFYFSSSAS